MYLSNPGSERVAGAWGAKGHLARLEARRTPLVLATPAIPSRSSPHVFTDRTLAVQTISSCLRAIAGSCPPPRRSPRRPPVRVVVVVEVGVARPKVLVDIPLLKCTLDQLIS